MGLWKGKKGSSVFYRIWNSNNKEIQGIREYRAEISNPQTDGQADQRSRMLPAQLIKGALRDIVSRSFQGVPYGSKSRLEFLKYALRAEVYPYLPKGSTEPVPGEYLISRGTLQQIECAYNSGGLQFDARLRVRNLEVDRNTTIGVLSQNLIENNPNLQEGDQLTFVGCLMEDIGGLDGNPNYFNWYYYSIVLDPANTNELDSVAGYTKVYLSSIDDIYGNITINGDGDNICAAAVIVSRLGSDGQYLRSNARLAIDPSSLAIFFDPRTRASTRASYQTKSTRSSYDWPVEDSEDTRGASLVMGTYTLSGLTGDIASLNGRQVAVQVIEGTNVIRRVYIDPTDEEAKYLVDTSGERLQYSIGGEVTYLVLNRVGALAGYPTILYERTGTAGRTAAPAVTMVEAPEPVATTSKKSTSTRAKK